MTRKILLVEDEPAYAEMLTKILATKQFDVIHAINREEALNLFEQHSASIFCVLQDLGLPPQASAIEEGLACMTGLLVMQPHLKVIVLTGRDRGEAGAHAIAMGAFDYLEKPIALEGLIVALERAKLFSQSENTLVKEGVIPIKFNAHLDQGLKLSRDHFEAALVRRVLGECEFNIRKAADILGVKREGLYYLLKKHNIEMLREVSDWSET
ncbi:Fis family transcriptional regulator [Thiomicrospira aerophila AL3]|uniref:Fis family transcriptional regulator n=1 Tax=Thiomicrospira aerophila AL3 TaxID=717772 RepID=W0DTG5_9GAMM|nr:response regulator [Thiomicrospira aerophila]AHF01905.1 Fis family transcriptional regulator [Thiomicrospira aerophila AL3]